MSFLNVLVTNPERAEELRNAWKKLSYKLLTQSLPSSPLSTPDSIDFELVTPSKNVRYLKNKSILRKLCKTPLCFEKSCLCHIRYFEEITKHQENIYKKQLSIECVLESTKSSLVRKRKLISDKKLSLKKNKPNKEEVACQVHGILSLPGCRDPRYKITSNELCRRANQPECLTKVDMISYVRLAKNSARVLLQKHNIKTNQHNQRSEHTVLSKMCEEECLTLAKGISDINYKYFPASWFAFKSIEEIMDNNSLYNTRKEALVDREKDNQVTKCVLLDIYFGLEKRKNDKEMSVFNLVSHSFGHPNLQNHILFLLSYLDEELRILRTA
ncbi:transcription factor aptf-4 isoform X2 [Hydra vulgaris]|uniref:Transcription factor aptf-4 isoform X2 n=1 Tax=Hydra vulgaris TaxID=6087 RepID=A0ABM4BK09_HYDVU